MNFGNEMQVDEPQLMSDQTDADTSVLNTVDENYVVDGNVNFETIDFNTI